MPGNRFVWRSPFDGVENRDVPRVSRLAAHFIGYTNTTWDANIGRILCGWEIRPFAKLKDKGLQTLHPEGLWA
jgi:hypothetical protein